MVSEQTEVWLDVRINPAGVGVSTTTVPFVPEPDVRSVVMHAEATAPSGSAGARLECLPVVWSERPDRPPERSRAKERVFSLRSTQHRWDPKRQRPEVWRAYNTMTNPEEHLLTDGLLCFLGHPTRPGEILREAAATTVASRPKAPALNHQSSLPRVGRPQPGECLDTVQEPRRSKSATDSPGHPSSASYTYLELVLGRWLCAPCVAGVEALGSTLRMAPPARVAVEGSKPEPAKEPGRALSPVGNEEPGSHRPLPLPLDTETRRLRLCPAGPPRLSE